MKSALQGYLDKFDALSLRERVMVYVAALVIVVGLAQVTVFDPLDAQKKAFAQVVGDQRADIEDVRRQVETLQAGLANDPDAGLRSRAEALRAQLDAADAQLRGARKDLIGPEQIVAVLEDLLGTTPGLQLRRLRTLPPEAVSLGGAVAAASDAPVQEAAAGLYRHGIEIELQGSYADLHGYLARLEAAPWRVNWGGVQLDGSRYPELVMTLKLYTFSLDSTWLAL